MILLPLILLQAVQDAGAVKIQRRVDRLVSVCHATDVVKFDAQNGSNEVIMHMLKTLAVPSKINNARFECVLAGMKRMPDLEFGFLGNAPSEPEAK